MVKGLLKDPQYITVTLFGYGGKESARAYSYKSYIPVDRDDIVTVEANNSFAVGRVVNDNVINEDMRDEATALVVSRLDSDSYNAVQEADEEYLKRARTMDELAGKVGEYLATLSPEALVKMLSDADPNIKKMCDEYIKG